MSNLVVYNALTVLFVKLGSSFIKKLKGVESIPKSKTKTFQS